MTDLMIVVVVVLAVVGLLAWIANGILLLKEYLRKKRMAYSARTALAYTFKALPEAMPKEKKARRKKDAS